ncbi:stage III sporulation protein AB [Butyricicoccus sp.]|uniref:stage III sporulation protein AB n=1 Tax=Butyricicoccus sp. TaxID=2049021 RepID=UPI003F14B2B2
MLEKRLEQAANCLPPQLRTVLEHLPAQEQARCEELRLRAGQLPAVTIGGRERLLGSRKLAQNELEETLRRATAYSVHTFADSLRQGFVTVQGGHRIGVCGQTAVQDGKLLSYRHISSLNIRVARQIPGAADAALLDQIREDGQVRSALFLAPPGRGKTTLLRDLARQLSDSGIRTALADERAELAALYEGVPQFDIGTHTDVIDGCPKAEAAMILVKTMSPQLLVLDEITSERDVRAAECASHCGTAVLASAHAWDMDDFRLRPLYRRLLDTQIFTKIFCIGSDRKIIPIV